MSTESNEQREANEAGDGDSSSESVQVNIGGPEAGVYYASNGREMSYLEDYFWHGPSASELLEEERERITR